MINCLWELGYQGGAKEMAMFLTQLGGGGSRLGGEWRRKIIFGSGRA